MFFFDLFRKLQSITERETLSSVPAKIDSKSSQKSRITPRLEMMEERVVPTVLFAPQFGVETKLADGGKRMASPSVYVVLWGSSWGGVATPAAADVYGATSDVISSNYLDGLAQYGMSAKATLKDFIFDDVPDPTNGFSQKSLSDEIDRLVAGKQLPDPDKTPNMIVDMVTAPGIVSDSAGAAGYNNAIIRNSGSVKYAYIWNGSSYGSLTAKDATSLIFSHEMAETMTDPGGLGYEVNPGKDWTTAIGGSPQIGDFEGNSYQYRLGTGALVQPYWSAADNKYIVTDGNTQRVDIKPNWNKTNFLNYDITFNGGQRRSAFGDTLFTNGQSSGDQSSVLAMVWNDELFQIDNIGIGSGQPGKLTANIAKGLVRISAPQMDGITINAGAGTKVELNSNSRVRTDVTINNAGIVSIGPSTPSSVSRTVTLNSPRVKTTLLMDNRSDSQAELFRVRKFGLESQGYSVLYDAGKINALTLVAGLGRTIVSIGSPDSGLETLPSNISVVGNNTDTSLSIDGTASFARTYTIDNASLVTSGTSRFIGNRIGYARLSNLEIKAGSSGNRFTINGSPATPATIKTGSGNDLVTINASRGPLSIDGVGGSDMVLLGGRGTLRNISGAVMLKNPLGFDAVTIDDSADQAARTAIVYKNSDDTVVYGLTAGGDIILDSARLSSLTVRGGSGGNTFRVHDTPTSETPGGLLTSIFTGSGPDQISIDGTRGGLKVDVQGAPQGTNLVNIGSTLTGLDPINGPVSVTGQAYPNSLNSLSIIDSATTEGQKYVLEQTSILRGDKPKTDFRNMKSVSLYAGAGGDSFSIDSSAVGTSLTLAGGPGDDGYNFGQSSGTLDGIKGYVLVNDQSGQGLVTFDDANSPVAHSYTLGLTVINTLAFSRDVPANIDLSQYGDPNQISYVSLNTGLRADTVSIQAVPANHWSINNLTAGDKLVVGSDRTGRNGTLDKVRGYVDAHSTEPVTVIVDDSADTVARDVYVENGIYGDPENVHVDGFQPYSMTLNVAAQSNISLRGGRGDDRFKVINPVGVNPVSVDAGNGQDTLDYSWGDVNYIPFTGGVRVDLIAGTATGLNRATGFENVIGSVGNDVILGDDTANMILGMGGNDVIGGRGGNDVLIGGAGDDSLSGGSDDDLLVGGVTDYEAYVYDYFGDTNPLTGIKKEWSRTDIGFALKIAHLTGDILGGLNGFDLLGLRFVDSTGQSDTLTGGGGSDWFLAPEPQVSDPQPADRIG